MAIATINEPRAAEEEPVAEGELAAEGAEDGAEAPEDGRMIAYFRPEWPDLAADDWLTAP